VNVFVVIWQEDERAAHVAADELGRPLLFQLGTLAALFASELRRHGVPRALALERQPREIADLLLLHDLDADDLVMVEAQTLSPDDAVAWATELAARVARLILRAETEP
jgi:hypothetical protein